MTIPKAVSGAVNLRIENLRLEKAVMEAAKEAAKDIKVSMKDETGVLLAEWTFAGQDLRNSAAAVTDVNLYMVLTPAKALTSANETLKSTIMSISENGLVITFQHNGQLPAAARIKVASGIKTGTGITTGIKPGGYVTITISHCSDYVLIPRKDACGAGDNLWKIAKRYGYTLE